MTKVEEEIRIFRCIGLTETSIKTWSRAFTVGRVYELVYDSGNILRLKGNIIAGHEMIRWVDANQFKEIKVEELIGYD